MGKSVRRGSTSKGRMDLEQAVKGNLAGLKRDREIAAERGLLHMLKHPIGGAKGSGAKPAKAVKIKAGAGGEYVTPDSPWYSDPHHFPHLAPDADQLRFCINFAVLAPSSHNSQPWKFQVEKDRVHVLADRSRALPVVDAEDRELTISCGCALHFLRVAMRRFGIAEKTTILPSESDHDLLATVRVAGRKDATADEQRRFDAIQRRRTTRESFADTPVPTPVQRDLEKAAAAEGAAFVIVSDARARAHLAQLISEGDVVQLSHRAFRRELALWMHHNRAGAHDGIPGYAMGMSELKSLLAPLVVRTFDIGEGQAARDDALLKHSPIVGVLGTPRDDARAWVQTGQALGAVLLGGTAAGVTASYLNQPIEVPELRQHLKRLAPDAGWPQIVLRMGYGPRVPHTPRRPVRDVLTMPMPEVELKVIGPSRARKR
jgi:hypothetical protein